MSITKLHDVYQTSQQSMWLDNLSRPLILTGELAVLVENGVRGVTSNPSIFQKALENGDAYNEQLQKIKAYDLNAEDTYWALVTEDIIEAAKVLRPVYDESKSKDGFVSVEVDPRKAHDTEGTIEQAIELHDRINQPNVMIKVPATKAGLPAITALIAKGINVNVTLIFSLDRYKAVMQAYMDGLDQYKGKLSEVSSVASFFVSRVDGIIDEQLDASSTLKGKAAIAQAQQAYRLFLDSLETDQWRKLSKRGATVQRPLWASTSTKNPDYADTLYVDSLVAPNTVNTIPPATLGAFMDHGTISTAITSESMIEAQKTLEELASQGIDIQAVTDELEAKGVQQFIDSFNDPIQALS